MKTFPLYPSLIIHSGGGLHTYWLFKEVWYFDNDAERNDARNLSKLFQKTLRYHSKDKYGWNLDLTDDLVRLLRVPGTYNFKSEPVLVKIIERNDYRYNPNDFKPYLISTDSQNFASKERKNRRA